MINGKDKQYRRYRVNHKTNTKYCAMLNTRRVAKKHKKNLPEMVTLVAKCRYSGDGAAISGFANKTKRSSSKT